MFDNVGGETRRSCLCHRHIFFSTHSYCSFSHPLLLIFLFTQRIYTYIFRMHSHLSNSHSKFHIASYAGRNAVLHCFYLSDPRYYGNILVHCNKGVSRSATFVIAYLMKKNDLTVDKALEYVKSKREIVSPNEAFIGQLRKYVQQSNVYCTARFVCVIFLHYCMIYAQKMSQIFCFKFHLIDFFSWSDKGTRESFPTRGIVERHPRPGRYAASMTKFSNISKHFIML